MKRSGGSRTFRSLGSRMRAFGRSLMRHYVPPEEMPPLDMSAPGWQSAAETPLLWPEAPASNAPVEGNEAEYFDAPAENNTPAAPRPRPAPARPAPAAPPPPQAPVQRKPTSSNKEVKVNPILYDLLAKNDAREAQRKRIREEKIATEIQRQADNPDAPPVRRRGRMGVDYVETSALAQGDDLPARPAKPSQPTPDVSETSAAETVQPAGDTGQAIQREAEADDGAEIFEDWNTDDDVPGDDYDGGTPSAVDPILPPMTPPGMALPIQRTPDETETFNSEPDSYFEADSESDTPQNFAGVSAQPPQQTVQRDFQPDARELADDSAYYEATTDTPEDVNDDGYVTAASETFAAPPVSQPVQRDYQPAAPDASSQAIFQQTDFNEMSLPDVEYSEDGDTRPMPVQRAPVLPPPTFDDNGDAAPADETGYESLADWVDSHTDAASTTPSSVQREYQPSQSVNFDGMDDGRAGDGPVLDSEDGDTRPMSIQRDYQPLPSPFEDDLDYEPSFDAVDEVSYTDAPATGRDVSTPPSANVVQRDFQPTAPETDDAETFTGDSDTSQGEAGDNSFNDYIETETDDTPSEQSTDVFTWSGDSNPPPANRAQPQTAPEAGYDENFAADTGDNSEPEYDEDNGEYRDFDAPEQSLDEGIYNQYSQPKTGVQSQTTSTPEPVQRQPEASYDDNFTVDDTDDYEAEADEYAVNNYGSPDETADDFNPPQQPSFTTPEVDNVPDFAAPPQTVQRQPAEAQTAYDEPYAAENNDEFFGEAEEYISPVYDEAIENSNHEYNPPDSAAPTQAVQRYSDESQTTYDEAYAAENNDEFFGEAENNSSEYNPPQIADHAVDTPDFAAPTPVVQRELYAPDENSDEFFGEAEEYIAPVYDETIESSSPDSNDYRTAEAYSQAGNAPDSTPPSNSVQRQPEVIYDETYGEDDAAAFDVNDYAAPVYDSEVEADKPEFSPPEMDVQPDDHVPDSPPGNSVQRQPAAPEMIADEAFYGDSDVADYADDSADYTYNRHDESHYGDYDTPEKAADTPDHAPSPNILQRQPEATDETSYVTDFGEYVDETDDDDSSLYDPHYQAEQDEFVPAARHIDAPFSPPSADPVQRAEQLPSLETSNPSLPPQFYGDDVYETDISALLGDQPDPRPVQRRAQLPDIAPESYYDNADDAEISAADTGNASVDLYQAMLETGLVMPDADAAPDFSFDSPTVAAPQSVQRDVQEQTSSPPLDLFQAMVETGMVQADRDDAETYAPDHFYAADEAEPMSAATKMDLLSFLDEPPSTPHADVNRTQSAENAISRVYEPPPQQPPNVVQRALTDEPEEEPENDSVGKSDVNVDQLARDVYSVLRNRLRIERERRDRKP